MGICRWIAFWRFGELVGMMNKPALIALLEALQNAKEGSRELSDRALEAAGYRPEYLTDSAQYEDGPVSWVSPAWVRYAPANRPDPSRSVDHALNCMVPESMIWNLGPALTDARNFSFYYDRQEWWLGRLGPRGNPPPAIGQSEAMTPATAICAARIKQLIGECNGS